MIRFTIGLIIVLFSVGSLDYATDIELIINSIITVIGLIILLTSIDKLK
jgi:fumarate reductase subunit C